MAHLGKGRLPKESNSPRERKNTGRNAKDKKKERKPITNTKHYSRRNARRTGSLIEGPEPSKKG